METVAEERLWHYPRMLAGMPEEIPLAQFKSSWQMLRHKVLSLVVNLFSKLVEACGTWVINTVMPSHLKVAA